MEQRRRKKLQSAYFSLEKISSFSPLLPPLAALSPIRIKHLYHNYSKTRQIETKFATKKKKNYKQGSIHEKI